jgi:hypothetical protein
MLRTRRPALGTALAGLAAGLALAWTLGIGRVPPVGAQPATTGDPSGTIAFTTGGAGTAQLLYLIDTRTQAFAVYRVDPNEVKGTVKLEAARQYRWDLKLGEYNNSPPEVAAVEAMVGRRPEGR